MGPRHGDEVELTRTIVRASGLTALPVPPMADPEAVLDRVLRARADDPRPAVPTRRRPVLARTAAVAATVVLALTVALTWPSGGPAAAVTPPLLDFSLVDEDELATAVGVDAREVLLDLADAASRRSPVDAMTGPVQYVSRDRWDSAYSQATSDSATWYVVPTHVESWLYPDGSLIRSEQRGAPLDENGEALDLSTVSDLAVLDGAIDFFPADELTPDLPTRLPRETTELRAVLLADGPCDPFQITDPGLGATECLAALVNEVIALHEVYLVPPDLDAAIWRMLAEEPSLRSLGTTIDRQGRAGVSVMLRDPNLPMMTVLIIDPDAGELLGWERLALEDYEAAGLQAPYVSDFTSQRSASLLPADAGPVIDPRMTCEDYGSMRVCSMPGGVGEASP